MSKSKPAPQTSPLPWIKGEPIREDGPVHVWDKRNPNNPIIIATTYTEDNASLIVRRVNEGPSVDAKLAAFEAMESALLEYVRWAEIGTEDGKKPESSMPAMEASLYRNAMCALAQARQAKEAK